MGIGREQARYMAEIAKFNKGDGWNGINGVSVMSKDHFYLKGGQHFEDHFQNSTGKNPFYLKGSDYFESPFSNGIGDELSGCWVKYPRVRKDAEARKRCQENFSARQNTELALQQQSQQLAQQALTADQQSRWSAGQVALVSVVGLAALTGMAIAIKKFAK